MTTRSADRTSLPAALWLVLGAGLALGFVGCDGQDATTEAVYQAEVDFVTVSGGPAGDVEYADRVYRTIESTLQPRVGKGPAGASEAASVLLAAAQQGLAASAADTAAGREHEVRSRLRVVMGQISEWSRLNALAEAAATYDARPELADIDQGLALSRRHLAEFEELQRDAQARVADLTAQVNDLRGRSETLRNQAGELQLEISRSSASRGAELAPRARALMDESDGLEIEAQRVQTTLEQYLPEANEIELNIERVNKQRELLTRTRTEVSGRAQAAQDDERRLRGAADQASRELKQLVSDLEQFRGEVVTPAFDEAATIIGKAVGNAKRANNASKDAGALTAGLAQQAHAQLELRRAQMNLGIAEAYEALSTLGVGPEYATLAQTLRTEAQAAHETARGAFEAAANSLRQVRVPGDAGDRLRASADLLDRYARAELGRAPDLSAPPEPEEEAFDEGFSEDETLEEGQDGADFSEDGTQAGEGSVDDGAGEAGIVEEVPVDDSGDGEEP